MSAYRFSISWPRVFPEGRGRENPAGWAYYHRLVDALREAGIEPVPTLFHWDLPQALQEEGGWPSRSTALACEDYARACYRELGGKVRQWITINEPPCLVYLGYYEGMHAPGLTDLQAARKAAHHVNLAHGLAVRAFRQSGRIEFLRDYLADAAQCLREGIDLRGYFLWSFIDNFEWAYGYSKRFGIVYCDFETLQRYPKDSYFFYRQVIDANRPG